MHSKTALRLLCLLLTLTLLFTLVGCGGGDETTTPPTTSALPSASHPALGDDSVCYGQSYEELGIYAGMFTEASATPIITCLSGTPGCYAILGNRIIFTELAADSIYAISGQFKGTISIDVGDRYKFDLELHGFSLISDSDCAITVLSGSEVSIIAKKNYRNFIYDTRAALGATSTQESAAIFSEVDLELAGKGALCVVSEHNDGIFTKDDLQVKNLSLTVVCADNALKGNDGVEITYGTQTLIATRGDGIKTKNSHISEKGNQKGSVTLLGCTTSIFAACDGIDAACDVRIEDAPDAPTALNIYTDKYSKYSETVTDVTDTYYVRYTAQSYKYSIKYYNSDTDYCWENATYDSTLLGNSGQSYYYYAIAKRSEYSKIQLYIYSASMTQGQDTDYLYKTDYLSQSASYDTLALTNYGSRVGYNWTNYSTKPQDGMRPGGPSHTGNTQKGTQSAKGMKAANDIIITSGTVLIKSYDDALHASADTSLDNGAAATQSVTVRGGQVTLYTNDDGISAQGALTVSGGALAIENCYEGLEGMTVTITGGISSIVSRDDGINSAATSGTAITVSGGTLYVRAGGDGIDSNTRDSYNGIQFTGGNVLILSTSGSNSAIDTEAGYTYTSGTVVAIMPMHGMVNESTRCQGFSSIGVTRSANANAASYLCATVGTTTVTVQMPVSLSAAVICLGSSSASVSITTSTAATLDQNGVCWTVA